MPKETPTAPEGAPAKPTLEPKPSTPEKKKMVGKWFRRIPKNLLLSPGGIVLIFFALIMEIIDLIPIPGLDSLTWELILEIIFCIFLAKIAELPFQSMIIPFLIERIPGLSDLLPTWLIRLFF